MKKLHGKKMISFREGLQINIKDKHKNHHHHAYNYNYEFQSVGCNHLKHSLTLLGFKALTLNNTYEPFISQGSILQEKRSIERHTQENPLNSIRQTLSSTNSDCSDISSQSFVQSSMKLPANQEHNKSGDDIIDKIISDEDLEKLFYTSLTNDSEKSENRSWTMVK